MHEAVQRRVLEGLLSESVITSWKLYLINMGFPVALMVKDPPANAGAVREAGLIPESGRTWRRAWPPTPVSLSEESHGQRSLAGYSLWGCKELDTTKATYHARMHIEM